MNKKKSNPGIEYGSYHHEGMEIRYSVKRGKGRPLLIFNGIGQNVEVLEPLYQHLPDIEVIIYDVPGTGLSDTPIFPWSYRRHARLAASLVRSLGYGQVDVMGISWGACLAQQFARQHRDITQRLILAAAPMGNLMVPGKPGALLRMANPRRFWDKSYMRSVAGEIYGGALRSKPELLQDYEDRIRVPNQRGYLYQMLAMVGWASLPWLRGLPQDTLILQGTDDPLIRNINIKVMAALIPNARVFLVECGHMFLLTQTTKVMTEVRNFVRPFSSV